VTYLAITNHDDIGHFDMRTFSSPKTKRFPVTRRFSSDLTPLYLLMAAGWFAAALLPAAFGRWLEIDTSGAGIALGCLCLAHAVFESSRSENFNLAGLNPFSERCVTPRGCFEFFSRRAEWEGRAAA